jgi:hypothetical protein
VDGVVGVRCFAWDWNGDDVMGMVCWKEGVVSDGRHVLMS